MQAYIEMLLTLNTLRLCHRYGKGPHCQINRLSIELLEVIEQLVLEPARQEALGTWSRSLQCFQRTCDVSNEHLPCEEMYRVYHEFCPVHTSGMCDPQCTNSCPNRKYNALSDSEVFHKLLNARKNGGAFTERYGRCREEHSEELQEGLMRDGGDCFLPSPPGPSRVTLRDWRLADLDDYSPEPPSHKPHKCS